jgi:hypothetical protein
MPPPIFAAETDVSVEKSRMAIERLLDAYQCRKFVSGIDRDAGRASFQFELANRLLRFGIRWPKDIASLPTGDPWRVKWNASRRNDPGKFLAQIERQRWRAIHLVIKAKLEAVSSGVSTFDEEFLPYVVLPDSRTVAETMIPLVEQAYRDGIMPKMQLLISGGRE